LTLANIKTEAESTSPQLPYPQTTR